MVWQRLVGSLKLEVSFAEYSLFYRALLQKRPIISRSLLFAATPYPVWIFFVCGRWRRSNSHSDTLFPVIFLACTPRITLTPYPLSSFLYVADRITQTSPREHGNLRLFTHQCAFLFLSRAQPILILIAAHAIPRLHCIRVVVSSCCACCSHTRALKTGW